MIAASIVPWSTWFAGHPETLLLETERPRLYDNSSAGTQYLNESGADWVPRSHFPREIFSSIVIGITLGEHAKAYPLKSATAAGVINDRLGPFPLAVFADAETKAVFVYLRRGADMELEFIKEPDGVVDRQTGSTWDPARGVAVDGPLRGELLKRVPHSSAFDWAWEDFHPDSEFYE